MTQAARLWIALALCLAGLLLMPAIQLATDLVDWRLFEGAYSYIFASGFETGTFAGWSVVQSNLVVTLGFPRDSAIADGILASFAADGSCFIPRALLTRDAEGEILAADCRALSTPTAIGIRFTRPLP